MWFKNIAKEKQLIDRELEVYRKEKLAEVTLSVAQAQEKGAADEREYECTWHNKREQLQTELAKLEAQKEAYVSLLEERNKNFVAEYKAVNAAKDKTIEVLERALKEVTEKIQGTTVTINPENKCTK